MSDLAGFLDRNRANLRAMLGPCAAICLVFAAGQVYNNFLDPNGGLSINIGWLDGTAGPGEFNRVLDSARFTSEALILNPAGRTSLRFGPIADPHGGTLTGAWTSLDGGRTWRGPQELRGEPWRPGSARLPTIVDRSVGSRGDGAGTKAWVVTTSWEETGLVGRVLATDTGGASWSVLIQSPRRALISDLAVSSDLLHALVISGPEIQRTEDAGRTWHATDLRASYPGLEVDFKSLALADDGTAWAVGNPGIFRLSRDGGVSWAPGKYPFPASVAVAASRLARDGRRGWLLGSNGEFAETFDGGASWNAVATPNPRLTNARQVLASEDGRQLIVVRAIESTQHFSLSEDGAATWRAKTDPSLTVRAACLLALAVMLGAVRHRLDGNSYSTVAQAPTRYLWKLAASLVGLAVGLGRIVVSDVKSVGNWPWARNTLRGWSFLRRQSLALALSAFAIALVWVTPQTTEFLVGSWQSWSAGNANGAKAVAVLGTPSFAGLLCCCAFFWGAVSLLAFWGERRGQQASASSSAIGVALSMGFAALSAILAAVIGVRLCLRTSFGEALAGGIDAGQVLANPFDILSYAGTRLFVWFSLLYIYLCTCSLLTALVSNHSKVVGRVLLYSGSCIAIAALGGAMGRPGTAVLDPIGWCGVLLALPFATSWIAQSRSLAEKPAAQLCAAGGMSLIGAWLAYGSFHGAHLSSSFVAGREVFPSPEEDARISVLVIFPIVLSALGLGVYRAAIRLATMPAFSGNPARRLRTRTAAVILVITASAVLPLWLTRLSPDSCRRLGAVGLSLLGIGAPFLLLGGMLRLLEILDESTGRDRKAAIGRATGVIFGSALVWHLWTSPEPLGVEVLRTVNTQAPTVAVAESAPQHRQARATDAPVYINAHGGGLRAAVFTALTLARADDMTCGEFGRHVHVASGVSGGSLGLGIYFAVRQTFTERGGWSRCSSSAGRPPKPPRSLEALVLEALAQDHLSSVVSRALGHDFLLAEAPLRGQALLESWEASLQQAWARSELVGSAGPFGLSRELADLDAGITPPPRILFNATEADTGGIVTFSNTPGEEWQTAVSLGQAVLDSARFPVVSPAGSRERLRLVDGGVFDNSGAFALNRAVDTEAEGLWLDIDGNPPDAAVGTDGWSAGSALLAVRGGLADRSVCEMLSEHRRLTHLRVTYDPDVLVQGARKPAALDPERCRVGFLHERARLANTRGYDSPDAPSRIEQYMHRAWYSPPLGWYLAPGVLDWMKTGPVESATERICSAYPKGCGRSP